MNTTVKDKLEVVHAKLVQMGECGRTFLMTMSNGERFYAEPDFYDGLLVSNVEDQTAGDKDVYRVIEDYLATAALALKEQVQHYSDLIDKGYELMRQSEVVERMSTLVDNMFAAGLNNAQVKTVLNEFLRKLNNDE